MVQTISNGFRKRHSLLDQSPLDHSLDKKTSRYHSSENIYDRIEFANGHACNAFSSDRESCTVGHPSENWNFRNGASPYQMKMDLGTEVPAEDRIVSGNTTKVVCLVSPPSNVSEKSVTRTKLRVHHKQKTGRDITEQNVTPGRARKSILV